ncbi:DUF1836 domain-containing protein [Aureibacillus halotolerans]|uniref:Uncharacterized protein DUF1836 n=1 Tax=Aureibacillus halotolerans TaxID=1508390 RepID=A0A4R6U650_9BACI|nr:DUF1836 domain-containing protein [Aureibacillus halotolerans]TDQ40333.1 uncharacterized protein DUF1836 [Aureibacillus halotolerans]
MHVWSRKTVAALLIGDVETYKASRQGKYDDLPQLASLLKKLEEKKVNSVGLSLKEIVMLGNMVHDVDMKETSVRNWLKRDAKELIGTPWLGRKYSGDQAVLLLLIEDLRGALDFASIRKVLEKVFNRLDNRNDDLVPPVDFYLIYAEVFRKAATLQEGSDLLQQAFNQRITTLSKHSCHMFDEPVQPVICSSLEVMIHACLASHFKHSARILAEQL